MLYDAGTNPHSHAPAESQPSEKTGGKYKSTGGIMSETWMLK